MKFFIIFIGIIMSSAVFADTSGCSWDVSNGCLNISNARVEGRTGRATLNNYCGRRVYVRYCFERGSNVPDCGQRALRNGASSNIVGYSGATGRVRIFYVGSKNSSSDWSCSNATPGWFDSMF